MEPINPPHRVKGFVAAGIVGDDERPVATFDIRIQEFSRVIQGSGRALVALLPHPEDENGFGAFVLADGEELERMGATLGRALWEIGMSGHFISAFLRACNDPGLAEWLRETAAELRDPDLEKTDWRPLVTELVPEMLDVIAASMEAPNPEKDDESEPE